MAGITSLGITRAASYWYPTMLAEANGDIGENKAAELLGLNLIEYRTRKQDAIRAVMDLIHALPSPIVAILDVVKHQPEFFNGGQS